MATSPSSIQKAIDDAEIRARKLIADIVPMIGRLKDDALAEVNAFLEDALKAARKDLHDTTKVYRKKEVAG